MTDGAARELFRVVDGRRVWTEPSESVRTNLQMDALADARKRGARRATWEGRSD